MLPYRDLRPSGRFPWMTTLLIVTNIFVFFYQISLTEQAGIRFIYHHAVIPREFHQIHLNKTPWIILLTAMFLHGGWFHLIGNLLYLWIFGDKVEHRMGSFRFFIFYTLCGLIATGAQIYTHVDSTIPALGASGAISGVLAAYLRLFPKDKIATLIPFPYFLRPIILPAWAVLGFWMFLQILQVAFQKENSGGGVAYFAHLGGFVVGFVLVNLFVRRVKKKKRVK